MLAARSPEKSPKLTDKAVDEIQEALDLFRQLSGESKDKFLTWCRWAVEDRDPETDPRKLDPYWHDFPACLAVKMPLRVKSETPGL